MTIRMLSGRQLERITEKVKGIFIPRTNNWREFSEGDDAPEVSQVNTGGIKMLRYNCFVDR